MTERLTENKSANYQSKIITESVSGNEMSQQLIDADEVHNQISKAMKRRNMMKLRQDEIPQYVADRVKLMAQRESKKMVNAIKEQKE